MRIYNTDGEWEQLGRDDPYYGVISAGQYHRENLTESEKEAFFQSGDEHIAHILQVLRDHFDPGFSPHRALDFGCGVGRLLLPLAERAQQVVGVDVSTSMLAEARVNCAARRLDNVGLLQSDDQLSALTGSFDLVHSFIVFQHIPPPRGERIFRHLLEHLQAGGAGAVHFLYAKQTPSKMLEQWVKAHVPFSKYAFNLLRRRRLNTPQMQMYAYDLNRMLRLLQNNGISQVHAELTDHAGELGIILYFIKPKGIPRP
jgi:SAM-dependent methyltransferase